MVGAFVSTAMVWQREYPLDVTYYDTLMTAATGLYIAGSARPTADSSSSTVLGRCVSGTGMAALV